MNLEWLRSLVPNASISVVAFLFFLTLKRVVLRRSSRQPFLNVLVKNTHVIYLLIASIYLGFLEYDSSPELKRLCDKLFILTSLFQAAVWGKHFIEFSSQRYFGRIHDGSETTASNLFRFLAKLCLYIVIFLLILHNFGVNIATLVTGLGVGGIAIALAVQNILGDLFASMTIVLDKPFVVGDFITVDDFNGTIEHIGMKTTRIRSLGGEQLIFSNTDLLKSRIRNYKRMNERRVVFKVGVLYETPKEKLQRIPSLIRTAIERQAKTRFERSHLVSFGDSALNFETVYWVTQSDYTLFCDLHQAIGLEIFEQFNLEGIGFAYPTQTVYLTQS